MSRGPRKKTAPYPDLPGPAKNLSQAVSFSLTREKAPIYTMGSPDVRAFSRNKRGIAGSLIWVNFDRHALLNVVRRAAGRFIANIDDIRPQFRSAQTQFISETAIFDAQTERGTGIPVSATIDDSTMPRVQAISGATGFKESAVPWYSDQILPFDITLAGCNEIGAAASMKIFGVEILNEGNGVSIDDAVSEMQATFLCSAQDLSPIQEQKPYTGMAGLEPALPGPPIVHEAPTPPWISNEPGFSPSTASSFFRASPTLFLGVAPAVWNPAAVGSPSPGRTRAGSQGESRRARVAGTGHYLFFP